MVYLVWLRISPLASCKLPTIGSPELECALELDDPDKLEARLNESLRRHRYEVGQIECVVPYAESEWDDARDPSGRVRALVERARAEHAPAYGHTGLPPPTDAA